MAARGSDEREIACQQVLLEDASVYSVQWCVFPAPYGDGLTAAFLLERYLSHIREYTHAVITPVTTAGGIEFRIFGSSLSILSFSPAEFSATDGTTTVDLCIAGGLLVQADACDRGKFTLTSVRVDEGSRVTLQLTDYCPLLLGSNRPSRLRKMLYRLTQAYIHKVVTVKYLARLYRELAGADIRIRLKKVTIREGEEI